MKLKDYEHRYDYTVKGKPFAEGFKELYYEYVRFGGVPNSVLYLDLEYNDIDYTAGDLYGQKVVLWELCNAEGDDISECWTTEELEEFLSNDEIKNLRQKKRAPASPPKPCRLSPKEKESNSLHLYYTSPFPYLQGKFT